MNKISTFLFITILMFLGLNKAKAGDYALNCYYDDNGSIFSFNLYTAELKDEYGILEPYDNLHPINLCDYATLENGITASDCYSTKRANLTRIGMMEQNGNLKCPMLSYSSKADAYVANSIGYNVSYVGTEIRVIKNTSKTCSYPENCNFLGQEVIVRDPAFTCLYNSTTSSNTIKIERETDGGDVYATYPSGVKEITTEWLLSESCRDIYYIASSNTLKGTAHINSGLGINPTLSDLCESNQTSEIEHFCVGDCNFEERACSSTFTCGGSIKLPKSLAKFTSNLYNIVKVMVPVLLIFLGILDMMKNVISGDDAEIKKRNKIFMRRMIAGFMIFLVMSIVQLLFGMLPIDNVLACVACFTNGSC